MEEIWVQISKWYKISNYGRVFDLRINSIIEPQKHTKGYYVIHGELLHRLVAKYFVPNPNNFSQVNHKDGNKHNNHYTNLEWCTNKYNHRHAWNTGLMENNRKCIGIRSSKRCKDIQLYKLSVAKTRKPVEKYDLNGKFICRYCSLKEAFTDLGHGCNTTLGHACRDNAEYQGYIWKYVEK